MEERKAVGGTAWLWARPELEGRLDYLFIDEAGQMSLAMALAASRAAKNVVLLGDPQQLEQPQKGAHPEGAEVAVLTHMLGGNQTLPAEKGLFLDQTWRLHPSICAFTSQQYYDGRLQSRAGLEKQLLSGPSNFVGESLVFVPVEHTGNQNRSTEEIDTVRKLFATLIDGKHEWQDMSGNVASLSIEDVLVVAPYNAQVSGLRRALPDGARIGTVDKFQGQEAPVVVFSLTSSSIEDAPRGMGFLFSANRFNVATSRARCLVIVVGNPALFRPECKTPDQMRLANGFCRYAELATTLIV